ncbi:Putative malate transporter YflS [Ralstonia syzygii subsp. syzygii]|nr:Putative malate transporter YflS [Ralstonia syzygii subsp. syzygii]
MLLPGLVCLAVMPLVIYLLSPPELKVTPNAVEYARTELARMGSLAPKEKVMMGTFGLLLVLWANVPAMLFGPAFTLDPTVVAFLGLFVLIITGTIDWDDVLSEKSAWDTLVWFSALVMMAEQLNKIGVIAWFSESMKGAIVASGMG